MESVVRVLGKLLYNVRAGDTKLLIKVLKLDAVVPKIEITSTLFTDNGYMPQETAGEGVGDNKSPSLRISIPDDPSIKSIVIICQDIDPPLPSPITHLLVYKISPQITEFKINEFNGESSSKFKLGVGFRGSKGYRGPRPVIGHGDHRYIFQVLAINEEANQKLDELTEDLDTEKLIQLINGNVVSYGTLTGLYKRD